MIKTYPCWSDGYVEENELWKVFNVCKTSYKIRNLRPLISRFFLSKDDFASSLQYDNFAVPPWASEGFFKGWTNSGFFQRQSNRFFQGAKSGEISFYALETKKTKFFAKNLIGKCQISKCGVLAPPTPSFQRPCVPLCLRGTKTWSCWKTDTGFCWLPWP